MLRNLEKEIQDILVPLTEAEIADQKNLALDPERCKHPRKLLAFYLETPEFAQTYSDTRYGRQDLPKAERERANTADYLGALNHGLSRYSYQTLVAHRHPNLVVLSPDRVNELGIELLGLKVAEATSSDQVGHLPEQLITPIRILDIPRGIYAPDAIVVQIDRKTGQRTVVESGEYTYRPEFFDKIDNKAKYFRWARRDYKPTFDKSTLTVITPNIPGFVLGARSQVRSHEAMYYSMVDLIDFGYQVALTPRSSDSKDTLANDRPDIKNKIEQMLTSERRRARGARKNYRPSYAVT